MRYKVLKLRKILSLFQSIILHSCLDNLNWNRASRPFGLLARLTTQKKKNMDPRTTNNYSPQRLKVVDKNSN